MNNKANKTLPVNLFDSSLVQVGKMSYGPLTVHTSGAKGEKLNIGHYVSIAYGVKFILGGNHHTDTMTTFPHKYMTWGMGYEAVSKGPILVEDEVWIGTDAIILSGITLGKGCIIAAGSVVTKSVPPFAIVGGNPAKVIRYRFDDNIIDKLQKIDYSKINWELLQPQADLLYSKLTDENLESILKVLGDKSSF